MASIQSSIIKFWIRRLSLFGTKEIDMLTLRKRIEIMALRSKIHPGVHVEEVNAGGVPSEWLTPHGAPDDCALMYIHGGAWFMGSTRTHRALVARLAHASRIRALSINYRLAPEHPFPAGLEDCLSAYDWLLSRGVPAEQIVVAGDSAGGNLTLALLVALRDAGKPLPAGAVCLSPATDLTPSGEWEKARERHDPFFSDLGENTIIEDYVAGKDPCAPLISPINADLTGLPPLLLHVGDNEVLLDCVVRFAGRAKEAGVNADLVVWPGMFHVFHMFEPFLPEARRANDQIADFISAYTVCNEAVL